jgi:hypothetical protein
VPIPPESWLLAGALYAALAAAARHTTDFRGVLGFPAGETPA